MLNKTEIRKQLAKSIAEEIVGGPLLEPPKKLKESLYERYFNEWDDNEPIIIFTKIPND